MSETIATLPPIALWQKFYRLTRIPRPSCHERRVREYLTAFGQDLGLETLIDDAGNVLIRKPAAPGYEQRAPLILQGHMDMVPQANADSTHDFAKDPITTRIDGDWVTAERTTLGADNGIGVAAMLAILGANDLQHGPLEVLFTSNEEIGMHGAFGLKPGVLSGKMLINTDMEEEGELCIGCAGGANVNSRLMYREEPVAADWVSYRLCITGLRGGHSGVDIHRGRGNAVALLFRLLKHLQSDFAVRIKSLDAGNLRNAIPREAFCLVAVEPPCAPALTASVKHWQSIFSAELKQTEPQLQIALEAVDLGTDGWIDLSNAQRLVHAICACPSGVIRMSDEIPGLVESSNNLAIVRSAEGEIHIHNLVRSSIDSARDDLCGRLASLFTLAGAETWFDGQYPGWLPDLSASLLDHVRQTYRELFGVEAKISAVHAGLECGILGAAYPGVEMISFGPTIRNPHSPDERVEIKSVARFWDLLVNVLARV